MTTVLITGANRGIGLEFVHQYAKDGAHVIAACRSPEGAMALAAIAKTAKDHVRLLPLDVTNAASVEAAARDLAGTPIDILINNAGVGGQRDIALGKVDFADFEETLKVNTLAPYRVINALIANVRAGKDKKIVIVSSQLGSIANTGGFAVSYRTSKAGANMIARTLAKELVGEGIIVVPVHPGWVRTDMGGQNATLSPEESVRGLRAVISGLTIEKSGHFFQWNGEELPW